MAMKMSVCGKVDTESKTRLRLADPERVKKDLENERRITRLQQVREKSSSLARHIRQEVAAEQARQVKNLEKIKQKELDTWREHVVAKKCQDYRTSMFQVGAAHRAAQAETECNEKKQQQRAERIEKCRRLAAKRGVQYKPTNLHKSTIPRGVNMEGRATAGTQTPVLLDNKEDGKENVLCNIKACKVSKRPNLSKRKRPACRLNRSRKVGDEPEIILDSSSESCDNDNDMSISEDCEKKLQKTPAVFMHVDDESEDSMEGCKRDGIEINDLHMPTNRKFSRVVRASSASTSGLQPAPAVTTDTSRPSRPRFTIISELVRRTDTELEAQKSQLNEKQSETQGCSPRSSSRSPSKTTKTVTSANVSPTRTAKESTSVSGHGKPSNDQQSTDVQKRSSLRSANKVIDAGTTKSAHTVHINPVGTEQAKSSQAGDNAEVQKSKSDYPMHHQQHPHLYHMHQVPMDPMHMQQMHMLPLPPYMHPIHPHAMYGSQMVPPYNMMPYAMPQYAGQYTSQTTSSSQVPTGTSASNAMNVPVSTRASHSTVSSKISAAPTISTGRVQFYDHNNKYFRDYKAPDQAVKAIPQDATQRSAMENARIETEMRKQREEDLNNLKEMTQKRGQKALQREQVRRDCAELEEKLDALAQQNPQLLPNDGNFVPSHRFADLALRREQKMNAAMEEMLLRPAIVTCPEINVTKHVSPRKGSVRGKSVPEAINVGEPPLKSEDAVSTASCGSILLDYVNDQSKQLRTELKGVQSNTEKCIKLKSLLQRIEKLRAQLLEELQAGDMNSDNDNVQRVIDSIRTERANINTESAVNINQREMELQKKEELLEQRLRLLYKQQKKSDCQNEQRKKDESPVEIIIKVKSDGTVKQYVPKGKGLDRAKSSCQEIKAKPTASSASPVCEKRPTTESSQCVSHNLRQTSIDSNSTSYRELPPVIYTNVNPVETVTAQPDPLHPLVAHYVDKLLSMSRTSVDQLCVSSTDVPTPSESIVNTSRNITSGSQVNEKAIDNHRVERVQAFIQENRCFVNELEDTLRNQQREQEKQQKEPEFSRSKQIWDKQLSKQKQKNPQQPVEETSQSSNRSAFIRRSATSQELSSRNSARSGNNTTEQGQKKQVTIKTANSTSRVTERQKHQVVDPACASAARKPQVPSEECTGSQMERYAMLTENCTQRIAELTELITKVREEKQRLVEVSLTSASEGDRHSTEYFELPLTQGQEPTARSRTASERSDSHNTTTSQSEALPLQKNKLTGCSLDSGISISRPMTALGPEPTDAEPLSLPSSVQSSATRRCKAPPATIRRYSPQLAAEEQAHELSTITEVDTPGQSHMVQATPAAVPFPSFAQYAEELELDLNNLDTDLSMRLQHEFQELINTIKRRGGEIDYREFPSISAYLHELTTTANQGCDDADTQGDLLPRLCLPNVSIREFPNRSEYIRHLLEREPPGQREMVDSASLNSSDSFNVEAELRQRHLLKSSFRREEGQSIVHNLDVASSTRRESVPHSMSAYTPYESGIQPMCKSPLATEEQVLSNRIQLSGSRYQKEPKAMQQSHRSRRSTGGGLVPELTSLLESPSDTPQDVSQIGRSLNLREFLTKELLKHHIPRSNSGSESSDESLKSNFLHSIIESLSPSAPNTPAQGHATNCTNDRQKTSTPVGSILSTQEKFDSMHSGNTQLFSVESRISAVNYADGTPPLPYEHQTMATGKSSAARSTKTGGKNDSSLRK